MPSTIRAGACVSPDFAKFRPFTKKSSSLHWRGAARLKGGRAVGWGDAGTAESRNEGRFSGTLGRPNLKVPAAFLNRRTGVETDFWGLILWVLLSF